jgi:WD40 repeat protein
MPALHAPLLKNALITIVLLLATSLPVVALGVETAEQAYQRGLSHQQSRQTEQAILAYQAAIKLDPGYGVAHYEIGWSYWVLGRWQEVVTHWEQAKRLKATGPDFSRYLVEARNNLEGRLEPLVRAEIGSRADTKLPDGSPYSIELVARFQHYNPRPTHDADKFDRYVFSPKSVRFLPDGSKVYVNALEGFTTIIYDPRGLRRSGLIVHRFKERHQKLFALHDDEIPWLAFPATAPVNPDIFSGKPVESALGADGRYLWVPYYRRDFDNYSTMPSAVAIIDVTTDRIVRIMPTGPIPKYVVSSPEGNWMAVIHWGDNTIGLIDTRDRLPASYRLDKLITVGKRITLDTIDKKDRDHGCGFCLRGAVFTHDGKYLLVARMGGGGIAVVDVQTQRYIGTVRGMRQTPRHLVLSPDGNTLYLSSSFAGYVSAYHVADLIAAARRRQTRLAPLRETRTGAATRTIAISPDGRFIYAAVNKESKIVVLAAKTLTPLVSLSADSYPVGMAVSPDGHQLWVTAQGRKRRGGNSVMVYQINTQ